MRRTSSCASCGIAKVDDIKLKECDDCDLVKYCSVDCEREHKSQHKEACKKRAAELRDELLFKQPESSHHGDCPICMIPLPLDLSKFVVKICCSKVICDGCNYANSRREFEGRRDRPSCPFCRQPVQAKGAGEVEKCRMKRIEANDPLAMTQEGNEHEKKGDYSRAIEYYTKSAELGDADAHYRLAFMYRNGHVVEKDMGKVIHHLEEAAISGHPTARYNLGCEELKDGNAERAGRHFIIAANLGHDDSMKSLMAAYRGGFVSKEELAAALRAHHAAVDATKSPQRDAGEEFVRNLVYGNL